ncbi:MAG: FHA domain-containing protein, partial [Deltaproteobacteria bacterium]
MPRKKKISTDLDRFGTTEEIPRGRFEDIVVLSQRAYLEINGSEEKDGIFELGKKAVVIGRSKECDIRLGARNVSRKHARVLLHNEEYLIEDMEST